MGAMYLIGKRVSPAAQQRITSLQVVECKEMSSGCAEFGGVRQSAVLGKSIIAYTFFRVLFATSIRKIYKEMRWVGIWDIGAISRL
jgi:hypothetical protein